MIEASITHEKETPGIDFDSRRLFLYVIFDL